MLLYQRKTFNAKILIRLLYTTFLTLFLISVFSCGRGESYHSDVNRDMEFSTEEAVADAVFFESSAMTGRARSAGAGFAAEPMAAPMREAAAPASAFLAAQTANSTSPQQARKRIFSGGCTVRVHTASFAAGILEVSNIARKYNGWVDSSSDNQITIRIPVENFRKAFDEILSSNDVVDKFEEANDVTDQYSDIVSRLAVLQNARQRLEYLLASETDTERKVPILREIRRIDDQIERMRTTLEHLERAIAYSTITVTFVSHTHGRMSGNIGTVFRWVDSLDPFSVTVPNIFRKITVPLSDGFAVLRHRRIRYFHAETSDGTILRIGTLRNDPEGDSSFWRRAIIHTIGGRFSEYTEGEAGNVKYVLLEPKGTAEYKYLVGTLIKRKLIYVIEVYFPDSNSYEKWMESISESLEELQIR